MKDDPIPLKIPSDTLSITYRYPKRLTRTYKELLARGYLVLDSEPKGS